MNAFRTALAVSTRSARLLILLGRRKACQATLEFGGVQWTTGSRCHRLRFHESRTLRRAGAGHSALAVLDAVFGDLSSQSIAVEANPLGGIREVAVLFGERAFDEPCFECAAAFVQRDPAVDH